MEPARATELTGLLQAWCGGDQGAFEHLVEIIYPELRKIARHCLNRERDGHTLQATALVNEAYLRIVGIGEREWRGRAHFFAVAARVMRHILVDHARSRGYAKRGGNAPRLELNEALVVSAEPSPDLVRMNDALDQLAQFDARKAQIVEMRYFGGLNANEIAAVLGVSVQTVNRDWALAKVWLAREMSGQPQTHGKHT